MRAFQRIGGMGTRSRRLAGRGERGDDAGRYHPPTVGG